MKQLTFYAYGKGIWEIIAGGLESRKNPNSQGEQVGHASVSQEGVGTFGFWPSDLDDLFDCLGEIQPYQWHVNNEEFSVSNSIDIDDTTAAEVAMLINTWKANPPNYKLGSCDCVSFAMRIADCAGIGYNSLTQAPIALISSLKHHKDLMEHKYTDPRFIRIY